MIIIANLCVFARGLIQSVVMLINEIADDPSSASNIFK